MSQTDSHYFSQQSSQDDFIVHFHKEITIFFQRNLTNTKLNIN